MPFKSQPQRRKFAQLLVEGKISNETFEEWNREIRKEVDRKEIDCEADAISNCREGPEPVMRD